MPNLFIVAGPNGAGKTTYVRRFLPQEIRCREFVNADLIAAGLSPYAAEQAAFEAGRIMLRRLRELAAQQMDFSFETTLSGRSLDDSSMNASRAPSASSSTPFFSCATKCG